MMAIHQKRQINFALVTITKGICFSEHRPEGLEFIPSTESGLRFVLKPLDPKGDPLGKRKGLECKLYTSVSATEKQVEFVVSYNDHEILLGVSEEISLPYKLGEEILVDKDGKCKDHYSPRRSILPTDIQQLLENVESELAAETIRFLRLLRWRQGFDAFGEITEHASLYWKIGDGDYLLAPLNGDQAVLYGIVGIRWDDEDSDNIRDLLQKDNVVEPLGHTLVREAKSLANDSPMSAIMILTTALETAVKIHVSSIAPDTDWLLKEIPSPPIFKILRDYIPLIHERRGNNMEYWGDVKPYYKKVQKLVEVRNKVAHTGKIPDNAEPIDDYLELVTDLLYLLDVLAGHDWARSLASNQFCKALDWPNPNPGGMTIVLKPA